MMKWLTVIGLAATPALILGQSAACAAGIAFGFDPWLLVIIVAISGFLEGLVIVWLAVLAARVPRLHRFVAKLHTPRFDAWFQRWGVWIGLALGPAVVGQEPVIVALVWLGTAPKKLIVPLALSNAIYTVIYYVVVRFGWDAIMHSFS
jgi:membrane protein YqaA with SNARE-associated domain